MNNDKIELINQAMLGDKKALLELLRLEEKTIYATLFYLNKSENDLNDIAQDVLIKISKKISQLKKPDNFKTWLNQIIINSYYDYLRKNKRHKFEFHIFKSDDNVDDELIDNKSIDPAEAILYSELDKVIKKSIEKLPHHYKIPITLREIQGLSYFDISKITKTSINTVKSRISRARNIVKNQIKKYVRS